MSNFEGKRDAELDSDSLTDELVIIVRLEMTESIFVCVADCQCRITNRPSFNGDALGNHGEINNCSR